MDRLFWGGPPHPSIPPPSGRRRRGCLHNTSSWCWRHRTKDRSRRKKVGVTNKVEWCDDEDRGDGGQRPGTTATASSGVSRLPAGGGGGCGTPRPQQTSAGPGEQHRVGLAVPPSSGTVHLPLRRRRRRRRRWWGGPCWRRQGRAPSVPLPGVFIHHYQKNTIRRSFW
jgi:hypothetical protein